MCVTVQWGFPTFSTPGILSMLLGVLASIVLSVDDYCLCARLTNVPLPPEHAVNRGESLLNNSSRWKVSLESCCRKLDVQK